MSFNTASVIRTALAGVLKMKEGDMPSYYETHIPAALNAAYYEVLGKLLARGFTQANILAFDRGAEFEKDIALFWCLVRSGAYAGFDGATLQALDRRKELETVLVFVSGVWIQPASGEAGTVTTAGPSVGNTGVFAYDDSEDDLGIQW